MFARVEGIIHPDNQQELKRVFVMDGLEAERLLHLANRVMDIYAVVTGKQYTDSDLRDRSPSFIDQLQGSNRGFEYRFGMPKLEDPARVHGKLRGGVIDLILDTDRLRTAGFWVDTNDSDALTPMPEPSEELHRLFDRSLLQMADQEFGDITIPAPPTAFSYSTYRPDRTSQ